MSLNDENAVQWRRHQTSPVLQGALCTVHFWESAVCSHLGVTRDRAWVLELGMEGGAPVWCLVSFQRKVGREGGGSGESPPDLSRSAFSPCPFEGL